MNRAALLRLAMRRRSTRCPQPHRRPGPQAHSGPTHRPPADACGHFAGRSTRYIHRASPTRPKGQSSSSRSGALEETSYAHRCKLYMTALMRRVNVASASCR